MRTIFSQVLLGKFHAVIYIAIVGSLVILGVSMLKPVFLPLKGVAGFFLLTLTPGLLILYIMGINPLREGHCLLYSVGLSMVFLVFLALFLNFFYPLIGMNNPLTAMNILLNFTSWLALLLLPPLFIQKRRQDTIKGSRFHIDYISLSFALFPLISIIGAYLVNFYSENIIILMLLFTLSVLPFLSCIKQVPTNLYPMAVLAASLSLQFHKNLITNYVIGSDIQATFYFANLVNSLQIWSPQLGGDSPLTMLSVVPTFYSLLLNISLDWAFKILNSFLYALTPLCIYYVFKDVFGERAGFYASLFFAFQHGFIVYGTPCKQSIAEFFMALLLLAAFDKNLRGVEKALFTVLFSFMIVNSHYGVSFIFLLSIITGYIIFRFLSGNSDTKMLLPSFILFFAILLFSWYIYTSEGEIFIRIVKVWENILREVWIVISAQKVIHRTGVHILLQHYIILYWINIIIYLVLTACMITSVIYIFLMALNRRRKITEVDALALPFMLFLFASFFIAGGFGIDRMYVLSSVVLSGYLFLGYKTLVEVLKRTPLSKIFPEQGFNFTLAFLLSVLLLFNTGVIYQLAGTPIESAISLNPKSNTLAFSDAEMNGAEWLVSNRVSSSKIYCDYYSGNLFKRFYEPRFYEPPAKRILGLKVGVSLSNLPKILEENDLIYIRFRALVNETQNEPQYLSTYELELIELFSNKIYDNGDSIIYVKYS